MNAKQRHPNASNGLNQFTSVNAVPFAYGAGKIRLQPEHQTATAPDGAPVYTAYTGEKVAYR